VAGLSGGGSLRFSERITAGHRFCRAQFALGEGSRAALARPDAPQKTDAGSGAGEMM
jgi:hypothetical protein